MTRAVENLRVLLLMNISILLTLIFKTLHMLPAKSLCYYQSCSIPGFPNNFAGSLASSSSQIISISPDSFLILGLALCLLPSTLRQDSDIAFPLCLSPQRPLDVTEMTHCAVVLVHAQFPPSLKLNPGSLVGHQKWGSRLHLNDACCHLRYRPPTIPRRS